MKTEEIKNWIPKEKIKESYKDPFIGETKMEKCVDFGSFVVPIEKANKYNSYDEMLKDLLK